MPTKDTPRSTPPLNVAGSHPEPATPTTPRPDTAIILAGAVGQGAFAAGALQIIAHHHENLGVCRLVATSAGAMSGALYAAGIRAGRTEEAADKLVDLWTEDADWCHALDLSARDLLRRRGISTSRTLRGVVQRAIEPFALGTRQLVDLRLIVAALAGDPVARRTEGATSYETVLRFADGDFDDAATRQRLYTTVTASAAFPGLYAPVHLPAIGDCLDGGLVNNAPIRHALVAGDVRRVIVITSTPKQVSPPPLRGLRLAEHLVEILIRERLYRDIKAARNANHQLAALDELVNRGTLTEQALADVKAALRWQDRRPVELVEIRPASVLRGGAFGALSNRTLRREYLAEGRRAAEEALGTATEVAA